MLGAYGLIHRSLSAESVYVFGRGVDPGGWNVKVGGLGLLCVDEELEGAAAGALPAWLAPEAIQKGRWSDKSDVWAFGHVLWELHAGCGRRAAALLDAAGDRNSGELPRPSGCPGEVFSVISTCWATSPRKRPTFGELHQKLVAAYAQVGGFFPRIAHSLLDARATPICDNPTRAAFHCSALHRAMEICDPLTARHVSPPAR